MQKVALLLSLILGCASHGAELDWIAKYVRSHTCANLLNHSDDGKTNSIPQQFRAPLIKAYRAYLAMRAETIPMEMKEYRLNLPLRETISFESKTWPVLGLLGVSDRSINYVVQTEEGVRTIKDCSEKDYVSSWLTSLVENGCKVDVPVHGRDKTFLLMEYVMALPEVFVASESNLEMLGLPYGLALEIAKWAEELFADTTMHDREDALLELTTGRVVYTFPYRR